MLEIHIAPGHKPAFRVAEPRHQIKLEPDFLGKFGRFE
jgi:hypothetical protein